jgi:ABC-type phosphate/phosphonate transport system substrate-binding protein
MKPLLLLVPSSRGVTENVLRELRDLVDRTSGIPLAPVQVPSAALLPRMLEEVPDALAWGPGCTAAVLLRLRGATSLLSVRRRDRSARSAVLVARPAIEGLGDLAGRRMGWVSKLSETGYEVPRLYLESFGVDPSELFAEERFFGTHMAAISGLVRGDVDVVATHSGRLRDAFARTPVRLVASVGPLPADVIVAGPGIAPRVRSELARAMLPLNWADHAFVPAPEGHLGLFEALRRQARELRESAGSHRTAAFAAR